MELPAHIELPINNEQSAGTEPSVNTENPVCYSKLSEVDTSKDSSTIGQVSTHTKKGYQCQLCYKSYSRKFTLKQHEQKVHKSINGTSFECSSQNFACYICDQIFPDKVSLREHYSDHKRQPHKDSNKKSIDKKEVNVISNEVVIYSEELNIDNEWIIGVNSCSAESVPSDRFVQCENPLIDKHSLKETINPEDKNIKVSSMECIPSNLSVDSENGLFDKTTSKTNVNLKRRKRFQCQKCQRNFSKKYNLYRHIQKRHLTSKSAIPSKKNKRKGNCQFICDICSDIFLDKASHHNHYLVHKNNMQIYAVCNDELNIQEQCIIVCANEGSLDEQSCQQQFLLTRYCMPTKLKPYLCHICKESFEEKNNLKDHLAAHKAERLEKSRDIYLCDSCEEEFKDRSCLEQHLLKHEIRKSFICHLCKETFNTENSLEKHQSLHTNAENNIGFCCKVCNKTFDQKHNLNQHLLTHSSAGCTTQMQDELFVCHICNESLENKSSLICHLAIHDAGKRDNLNAKIICKLCYKAFTDQQLFQEHLFEHTNQKKIPCNICDEVFSSKESLERHMNSHKEKDIKSKFLCEICDKSFDESLHLSQHLLTHSVTDFSYTTEKEHLCHICNDSFDAEIDLKIHLEVHEVKGTNKNLEDEMFTCKTCSKEIKGDGHFRLHLLQHKNQKLFMCGVCNTSFVSQIAVRKHMTSHKNPKLYFCDICKKSFNQKQDLYQHKLVHDEGKKFVCGLCSKKFLTKFNLRRHLQKCQAPKEVNVIKKNQKPPTLSGEAQKILVTIPIRNSSSYSIYSQLHSFPSSLKYYV